MKQSVKRGVERGVLRLGASQIAEQKQFSTCTFHDVRMYLNSFKIGCLLPLPAACPLLLQRCLLRSQLPEPLWFTSPVEVINAAGKRERGMKILLDKLTGVG